MLREQVLESWKKHKEKFFDLKKGISVLSKNSDSLPMFPIGLTECRNRLESWTSYEYQKKLSEAKKEIGELELPEVIMDLWLSCSSAFDMFQDLTQGWKKEKDSYARYRNSSNDVDDW